VAKVMLADVFENTRALLELPDTHHLAHPESQPLPSWKAY